MGCYRGYVLIYLYILMIRWVLAFFTLFKLALKGRLRFRFFKRIWIN